MNELPIVSQQSGAAEACWAHNPEVGRSKLPSATFQFYFFFCISIVILCLFLFVSIKQLPPYCLDYNIDSYINSSFTILDAKCKWKTLPRRPKKVNFRVVHSFWFHYF